MSSSPLGNFWAKCVIRSLWLVRDHLAVLCSFSVGKRPWAGGGTPEGTVFIGDTELQGVLAAGDEA